LRITLADASALDFLNLNLSHAPYGFRLLFNRPQPIDFDPMRGFQRPQFAAKWCDKFRVPIDGLTRARRTADKTLSRGMTRFKLRGDLRLFGLDRPQRGKPFVANANQVGVELFPSLRKIASENSGPSFQPFKFRIDRQVGTPSFLRCNGRRQVAFTLSRGNQN